MQNATYTFRRWIERRRRDRIEAAQARREWLELAGIAPEAARALAGC